MLLKKFSDRFFSKQGRDQFTPYIKRKNVEGVVFDFWISDHKGRLWYDLNCTDPHWEEMRFLRDHVVEAGDIILECGGHHGCTAIVLSKWVGNDGKVITFEALPQNCDVIQKNFELNRLQNVVLERKAVGFTRGSISVSDASNSSVSNSTDGIEVQMTCLDEYEQLNPTFLKIDVEGFEMQVLEGAERILAKRPKLAIEIHTEQLSRYGASVEGILKLLGTERYELWIQWEGGGMPEPYDGKIPIEKRVLLFGLPRT